jgi:hypothetical protein
MSAAAILLRAQGDGLELTATPAGTIKVRGPRDAVAAWTPTIIENKGALLVELSAVFQNLNVTAALAFDPTRLQREADRRNADAARMGFTDRWCACGRLASYAWPGGRRRETWRCLDCGPVRGEA